MLTFSLKPRPQQSAIPIEAEKLLPTKLASLTIQEIENIPILWGNRTLPAKELFQISGELSDHIIQFEGETQFIKRIGERLDGGKIVVGGSTGMHTGAYMSNGEIEIKENAGDWLAAEMTGGKIVVHGNAGHQVGGAYRGSRRGMSGGTISIAGNAGDELGAHMRRGMIAVRGNVGAFAGVNMIAGSIAIGGQLADSLNRCGVGMKRGTIAIFGQADQPIRLPTSAQYSCSFQSAYFGLLQKELHQYFDWPLLEVKKIDCYRSDLNHNGLGEICIAEKLQ